MRGRGGFRGLEIAARELNFWPAYLREQLRLANPRESGFRGSLQADLEAWMTAEQILMESMSRLPGEPLPLGAARQFNAFADQIPVKLFAMRPKGEQLKNPTPWDDHPWQHIRDRWYEDIEPPQLLEDWASNEHRAAWLWITYTDSRGSALRLLWFVLQNPAQHRLKRCLQCSRWFVDPTRNSSKARCSSECTEKWWDRARRRQARHAQYRRQRRSIKKPIGRRRR